MDGMRLLVGQPFYSGPELEGSMGHRLGLVQAERMQPF